MFKKILVANRGEIAVRIIRTCRDLGISPVAVYSDADREALHVKLADEAFHIGKAPSLESYLRADRILDVARNSGCEAIHPGYGFLAENEDFAGGCADTGLIFIGPPASAIALMGNKTASRKAVETVGVRVVPGSPDAVASVEEARAWGERIGFPLLVKASAGGGGKGMRVVRNEGDLESAFRAASGEAQSSFGDSSVYIERYLEKPRHIEIQVLLDQQGNGIHLGERECSIQRRHQKLVEECPSPAVDEEFRAELGAAALKVARAAGYFNAGTVEFLVETLESGELGYYFLEMNTRLQVEHPVTELVTGLDLVREQILIASGRSIRQESDQKSGRIRLEGAAIECRIYAEDPSRNFFPSPGVVSTLFEPSGPGVRNDSGVYAGFEIPLEYDPLISKLITFGKDRPEAICRMRRALSEYKIGGVRTTIPFFQRLLSHPEFLAGNLSTHFIEDYGLVSDQKTPDKEELPAVAGVIDYFLRNRKPSTTASTRSSAWKDYGRKDWW